MDKVLGLYGGREISSEVLNKLHPDLAKVLLSKLESYQIKVNHRFAELLIQQDLIDEVGLKQWTAIRGTHFEFFDLIQEFAVKYPVVRYYQGNGYNDDDKRKIKADIFNQYVTGWSRLNNPQKETQV